MEVLGRMILQNSLAGSLFILLILIFRWMTRRTSKLYAYILWLLLLLVLFVPPIAGSPFWTARSLVPELGPAAVTDAEKGTLPGQSENLNENQKEAAEGEAGNLQANGLTEIQGENPAEPVQRYAGAAQSGILRSLGIGGSGIWTWVTAIWALGVGVIAVISLTQWLRLKRKTASAVRERGIVWRTDAFETPFVMPGIPSRIYLPFSLEGQAYADVLAHEKKHIRHKDPWIKCLYVIALMIHWFNPFVWLAFRLMGRDMEIFCDECVLKGKSMQEKKRYSQTLLDLACREEHFSPVLYFGESSTRSRIWHILYGKRPHILVSLLCLLLISGCGVTFLTTGEEAGEASESEAEADLPEGQPSEPEEAEEPQEEDSGETEESWTEKSIVGTGHPGMTQDFAPEELNLLGETEQFALYSMNEGQNFLVKAPDGCMIYAEAPAISNYEITPMLSEMDYDGDGENELAVITCVQHGTGLLVDSLFMTDHCADSSWRIYQYLGSDYLAQLTSYFSTVYDENGVRLLFDGSRAGMEGYEGGPVGITEYVDQEYLDNNYAYYAGSQIDFRFVEGTIWLRAELVGYSDIHFAGRFPGHALETTIGYSGEGEWNMATDVRYLDVNIDRCIEEGLFLYFTGKEEEFDQYYTTESFQPEPFDRVCRKMTFLIISYPWDNMDSGELEAYATVRLDDDDSLNYLTLPMKGTRNAEGNMDWKIDGMMIEK